jgi:hypothetical protein
MEKCKLSETEKSEQVKSKVKSMRIIFFEIKGSFHKEFVLAGQTVNSTYCCDISWRLCENSLHHDNAHFHTSFFTSEYLAKTTGL